jgi:phenylalanine-4-hydroxylase
MSREATYEANPAYFHHVFHQNPTEFDPCFAKFSVSITSLHQSMDWFKGTFAGKPHIY